MKTLTHYAALVALPLLLLAPSAHAQSLDFSLTPSAQTGAVGDTLYFTGTLSNPTADTVYLNSENISLDGPSYDASPFFFNAPLSLDPMGTTDGNGNPTDSYTGSFFNIMLDPSVAPGVYGGTVSILGGADPSVSSTLASQQFTVTVLAPAMQPVPELSSTVSLGSLLMLGSLGLLVAKRRRALTH